MSAPVPPLSRGLVTLDELRTTMHRLEGRLAIAEDLLRALVKETAAAAAPPAPAPGFRPEPVGAAAELPPPAPPSPPAAPRATRPARSRAWETEHRRETYRPYYDLGRTAAAAGIGIEACPLCGDRGVAGARRLAWQDGWRSVMSAP